MHLLWFRILSFLTVNTWLAANLPAVACQVEFDPNTSVRDSSFRMCNAGLNYYLKRQNIKFMVSSLNCSASESSLDGVQGMF